MAAKSETCAKTCDISSFVKKQLKLLDLERNAEIEESVDARRSGNIKELEKRGICVTKLYITSECTGLYGKHLVNFGRGRERKSKGKGKTKQENKDQFISHCLSNGKKNNFVIIKLKISMDHCLKFNCTLCFSKFK